MDRGEMGNGKWALSRRLFNLITMALMAIQGFDIRDAMRWILPQEYYHTSYCPCGGVSASEGLGPWRQFQQFTG